MNNRVFNLPMVFALVLMTARDAISETKTAPNWMCVNQHADWQPRDSQGEFTYDGHMWILGGWFSPQTPNPRDVWKSRDGEHWTRMLETAPWEHSDLSAAMVFKGRMWFMGGRKLPGAENSNRVWSSSDGARWTLETAAAGWSPRVSPAFAVFKNRMWILGGTENFYTNNSQTMKNDVWSSADGRKWKREVENAPWAKRAHARAVIFDNKLWLMGGGRWQPENAPRNDVWCSKDGAHWTQVTDAAAWKPRMWFSTVVYRDRMWVLGGWSKENGNFGDVWYSKDGRNWSELKSDVIWSRRHEPSAFVFKDRIWVAGGYAEQLNSEVWSLEIPKRWFRDE